MFFRDQRGRWSSGTTWDSRGWRETRRAWTTRTNRFHLATGESVIFTKSLSVCLSDPSLLLCLSGQTGANGFCGSQGAPGPRGDQGETGPKGLQTNIEIVGEPGEKGLAGNLFCSTEHHSLVLKCYLWCYDLWVVSWVYNTNLQTLTRVLLQLTD